jgi:hypothetical protein|mmetsp:Transcript_43891/g.74009  ORF Transcript_43891/g.74009 Transcript_43891/m.74009 type:complete len:201 (+) Transcript_43891:360-962(+)
MCTNFWAVTAIKGQFVPIQTQCTCTGNPNNSLVPSCFCPPRWNLRPLAGCLHLGHPSCVPDWTHEAHFSTPGWVRRLLPFGSVVIGTASMWTTLLPLPSILCQSLQATPPSVPSCTASLNGDLETSSGPPSAPFFFGCHEARSAYQLTFFVRVIMSGRGWRAVCVWMPALSGCAYAWLRSVTMFVLYSWDTFGARLQGSS